MRPRAGRHGRAPATAPDARLERVDVTVDYRAPESAALYRALIVETVAVGRAAGVDLPADAVEAAVALIRTLPADMRTSMQLDYERRRRVELEDITGAVARLGRRLGVPTPTYEVRYAVLKGRAAAFGGLSR